MIEPAVPLAGLQQPGDAEAEQRDPQDHRHAADDVGVQRRRTAAAGTAPASRTLRAIATSRPTTTMHGAQTRKIWTSNQNGAQDRPEASRGTLDQSKNDCADLLPARRLGDQPDDEADDDRRRRGGDGRCRVRRCRRSYSCRRARVSTCDARCGAATAPARRSLEVDDRHLGGLFHPLGGDLVELARTRAACSRA